MMILVITDDKKICCLPEHWLCAIYSGPKHCIIKLGLYTVWRNIVWFVQVRQRWWRLCYLRFERIERGEGIGCLSFRNVIHNTQNESVAFSGKERKVMCHKHCKMSSSKCTSKKIGNVSKGTRERKLRLNLMLRSQELFLRINLRCLRF